MKVVDESKLDLMMVMKKNNLKDISNFIDQAFAQKDDPKDSQPKLNDESLDVIPEQLFEDKDKNISSKVDEQNTAKFGPPNNQSPSEAFMPNKLQKLDQVTIDKSDAQYQIDYFKNYKSEQVYSDKEYKEAQADLKSLLHSIDI